MKNHKIIELKMHHNNGKAFWMAWCKCRNFVTYLNRTKRQAIKGVQKHIDSQSQ